LGNLKLYGKAPTRADLAGGTLDIWPLSMLVPNASTLNVALSAWVSMSVEHSKNYILSDGQRRWKWNSLQSMTEDGFGIYAEVIASTGIRDSVQISILDRPPRGSGLGGSSALMVLLSILLYHLQDHEWTTQALVSLLRDLEVRVLGYPTGNQDYFPPIVGGGLVIHHRPGGPEIEPLPWIDGIEEMISVYATPVEHHSGSVNWKVVRNALDHKYGTLEKLTALSEITARMRSAWVAADERELGRLVTEEWTIRKTLHPAMDHPSIQEALQKGMEAGALGGKASGAGGGGTVLFVHSPGMRETLAEALCSLGGGILPCSPTRQGFQLWT